MHRRLRHVIFVIGIVMMATSLSGCIIEDGHHCGWWRCH